MIKIHIADAINMSISRVTLKEYLTSLDAQISNLNTDGLAFLLTSVLMFIECNLFNQINN